MDTIKHILVASDFSSPALSALHYGLKLAKIFNTEITFLHVSTIFDQPATDQEDSFSTLKSLYRNLETQAEEKVCNYLAMHVPKGISVKTAVRSGYNIAEEILTFIKDEKIDLVTLGTQGQKPLSEWIFGSVADKVVKIAPCPVLVTREQTGREKSPESFKKLLVATDFSHSSEMALKMAGSIATKATIIEVIHVIDDGLLANYGNTHISALMPDLQRRAGETLEQFTLEHLTSGIKAHPILEVGSISDKIIEYANNSKPDMIIMGHRSRHTSEPILLGSVSNHVSHRSRVPVLVMK